MTRHPLRWESLAFGVSFLAVVGSWAVWKQDLLTARQFSLGVSAVLIVLGLVGVAATLFRSRASRPTTTHQPIITTHQPVNTTPEGPTHEDPDPKP